MRERKIVIFKKGNPIAQFCLSIKMYCRERKAKEVKRESDGFSCGKKQKKTYGVLAGNPLYIIPTHDVTAALNCYNCTFTILEVKSFMNCASL